MRQISEATKITKVVSKILALLEKEELTDAQVESVLKSTEVSLGMKPHHQSFMTPQIPSQEEKTED